MMVAGTLLRAILVGWSATKAASSFNVSCPLGTRVYSLTVWSGWWLYGLVMRCTGGSEDQTIPAEITYDDYSVKEEEDVCAGTAGVQSIHWEDPELYPLLVYLNITCLDNQTYYNFAEGIWYPSWNVTGTSAIACDGGEYVRGFTYNITYPEHNTSFEYYLTDLDFVCSSSTLDPICTNCSGGTTLLADEEQPVYCELPSCTEVECCESSDDDGSILTTLAAVIIFFTAAAAIVVAAGAYIFYKIRKNNQGQEDDGVS